MTTKTINVDGTNCTYEYGEHSNILFVNIPNCPNQDFEDKVVTAIEEKEGKTFAMVSYLNLNV